MKRMVLDCYELLEQETLLGKKVTLLHAISDLILLCPPAGGKREVCLLCYFIVIM